MTSIDRSNRLVPIWLMAIILVGTSFTANAALVQITQFGNQTTAGAGINLNADVTGDGNDDITITGTYGYTVWTEFYAGATINGIEFTAASSDGGSGSAIYSVDSVTSAPIYASGVVGETYFLPFSFTDLDYNPISVDALLEIRVEGNIDVFEQTGVFLRRILFNLDTHGTPTGYSEFTSYPEAQHVVPIPAAAWLFSSALAGLGLFGRIRKQSS